MMKQRLICLICLITMAAELLCGIDVYAVGIDSECNAELIKYILPQFEKKNDNVTRKEFVKFAVRLRYKNISDKPTGFKDVDEYDETSGEISLARSLGLIDSGDMFFPDLPITDAQAKKLLVRLLGYGLAAEYEGGYPIGYAKIADELDLFKNVSYGKYITWNDFEQILFNTLNAPLTGRTLERGNASYLIDEDANLLNTLYDIYEFSGIQSANHLTNLTEPNKNTKALQVVVSGQTYAYSGEDYIGYNVSGYYFDNDGEKVIVTMRPYKNDERHLKGEDIVYFDGKQLKYDNGSRIVNLNIYAGFSFIYNYKAYGKDDINELIKCGDGDIVLIDSDHDAKFETIKMIKKNYMVVKNVNTFDMRITGKDFSQGVIDLNGEAETNIRKKGKTISINDIAAGELLCYAVSDDLLYYDVEVLYNEMSGRITGIDKEENIIFIDGEACKYNSHFKKYYEASASNGTEAVFLLDDAGKISCIAERVNSYLYGWIMRIWNDDEDIRHLKIFSETGDVENYKLSERVYIDGVRKNDADEIDSCLDITNEAKRFIRFYVNGEKEISNIDFSQDASGKMPFNEDKNDKNSLTSYWTNEKVTYLSSGKVLSRLCRIDDGCKIFIIPKSEEKRKSESNYMLVQSGYLSNNTSYEVSVYDIDEVNGAKAIVIFDDRTTLATEAPSAVVESVRTTVNAEDEIVYEVTILRNGAFVVLTGENDVKNEVEKLNPGDIIRYREGENNELLAVNREYNFANDVLLAQDINQVKYVKGYLWGYTNGYATILEKDSVSDYTYKDMSFVYFGNVEPSHIYVKTDSDGKIKKVSVRQQPEYAIESYRNVGAECNRIVTRSRFESLNSVWIYHIEY